MLKLSQGKCNKGLNKKVVAISKKQKKRQMKIPCKGKSKALRDHLDLRDKKSNFKHFTAEVMQA